MRFLVFGAGVIGSLYAGKLALAGHEVEIVARGRRQAEIEKEGLRLFDEVRGRAETAPVRAVAAGAPSTPYDAVFVAPRRDQLGEALPELARLGAARAFVTMTNGADIARLAGSFLGEDRLILGFPGAGGTRRPDGSIAYRIVPGLVQLTTLGESAGGVSPRVRGLVRVLRVAGFPTGASADMTSWQRSHLALVCPIANAVYLKAGGAASDTAEPVAVASVAELSALGRGALAELAADPCALAAMVDAIREGFDLVRALGGRVEPSRLAVALSLPRGLLAAALGKGLRGEWGETVVARHALSARTEMRGLNKEVLDLAAGIGRRLPVFEELAAKA